MSPAARWRVSHSTCRHRNRASAGTSRAGGCSRRSSATRPAQDARTVRTADRISAAAGFMESVVTLFVGTLRITRTTLGLAPLVQSEYSAGSFNRLPTRRSRHAVHKNSPPPALPGSSPALPFRAFRHDAARHSPRAANIPPLERVAHLNETGRLLRLLSESRQLPLRSGLLAITPTGTAGEPTRADHDVRRTVGLELDEAARFGSSSSHIVAHPACHRLGVDLASAWADRFTSRERAPATENR